MSAILYPVIGLEACRNKASGLTTPASFCNHSLYESSPQFKLDASIVQSIAINGPHRLTPQKIDEVVTKTSPGNFALGRVEDNGFCVLYIGRDDHDVAKRLRSFAGWHPRYREFVFGYAPSVRAAFDRECEDFHDYGGTERLDNLTHPKRPSGTKWLCPRCDFYR
jgi:hypothetical protein